MANHGRWHKVYHNGATKVSAPDISIPQGMQPNKPLSGKSLEKAIQSRRLHDWPVTLPRLGFTNKLNK